MDMNTEPSRVLVVADIWCRVDDLCDRVREEVGDPDPEVLVIAPPLASRLHTFASDTDKETEAAKERLADVLRRLEKHGVKARGQLGAHDPTLAIDDALAQFPAQKVILITDTSEHENWREHRLPSYLEELDLPFLRLIVPHELAE